MNAIDHASLIRVSILFIWLAVIVVTPYADYALLPDGLPLPQGLARVILGNEALRGFWFKSVVLSWTKWTAATLACLLILWPRRFRWGTVPLCGLVLVLDGLTKSIKVEGDRTLNLRMFFLPELPLVSRAIRSP